MSTAQLGSLGFTVLVIAGFTLAAFNGKMPTLPDARGLGFTAAAAVIGVIAYSGLTRAMRIGNIGFVTQFRYTRLVFALLIAVVVFGERPDALTLTGAAAIVLAGLYSFARARSAGSAR